MNSEDFFYSQRTTKSTVYASASEQPVLFVGFKSESPDKIVYVKRLYVDLGNKRHHYDIVPVNGEYLFSTFGTSGRY